MTQTIPTAANAQNKHCTERNNHNPIAITIASLSSTHRLVEGWDAKLQPCCVLASHVLSRLTVISLWPRSPQMVTTPFPGFGIGSKLPATAVFQHDKRRGQPGGWKPQPGRRQQQGQLQGRWWARWTALSRRKELRRCPGTARAQARRGGGWARGQQHGVCSRKRRDAVDKCF